MKRRTKRDLSVFLGVLGVLGAIIFLNTQLSRQGLAAEFDAMRTKFELARMEQGIEIMPWATIKKTKGTLRKGGTYHADLFQYNGQRVNLMGFMVPQEQFREVNEFLMLPIPIECYFCAMPPARDVMLVRLAEGQTTDIYDEPVLINGTFDIHEGEGVKYFYSIQGAKLGAGETGGDLNKRRIELQHMLPQHERDPELLLPGRKEERAIQESD